MYIKTISSLIEDCLHCKDTEFDVTLKLVCCYSAFFTDHTGEFDIAIRIYRGIFLFVLVTFLLAVNTWGWRKAGVNHVLIFELDPRDHLSYQHLLEVIAFSLHSEVDLTLASFLPV